MIEPIISVDRHPESPINNHQLEMQLDRWFNGMVARNRVEHTPTVEVRSEIMTIIKGANEVATIVASKEYRDILEEEQRLAGEVDLGAIGCVDGRLKRNFPLGFIVSSTEEPAGEVGVREGDILESLILTTALDRTVTNKRDLLQLCVAHTSLTTDHKCGAIKLKQETGEIPSDEPIDDAALRLVEEVTLQAITKQYNSARTDDGLQPLASAGVPILYDTDTMGFILGYDRRNEQNGMLSTSVLTKAYAAEIAQSLSDQVGDYGSMRELFTHTDYFLDVAKKQLVVEKFLLEKNEHFVTELNNYIEANYNDLTDRQKQGLRFILTKSVAFQYLSGLASAADHGEPDHPFAHHNERYMAISPDGKTFGARHPGIQVFSTSPSSTKAALNALKVEIGIRSKPKKNGEKNGQHIIFVTTCVPREHIVHDNPNGTLVPGDNEIPGDNETVQRAVASLIGFIRKLTDNKEFNQLVKKGEVLLVPGLIEQSSRELIRIPYIVNNI